MAAPVMLVVMENQQRTPNVIGSSSAPYINNTLVAQFPQFTNYWGASHPSLPNYLELWCGSTFGITDDNPPSSHTNVVGQPNLGAQLDTAGISWKGYFENIVSGGTDAYGNTLYQVHHNPCAYTNTDTAKQVELSANRAGLISDLNSGSPPSFCLVVPNMLNDMHDPGSDIPTAVAQGDLWLSTFIPAVQGTSWYAAGGTILVIWDEGATATAYSPGGIGSPVTSGGPIPGVAISAALKGTADYTAPLSHAGLLRGIELHYGLPLLGDAANGSYGDITGLLQSFTSKLGIYVGWAGSPSAQAAELGLSTFPYYMAFVNGNTAASMVTHGNPGVQDVVAAANAAGSRLIFPFNPATNDVTLASAASGGMNSTATFCGNYLVANGQANAI